MTKIELMDVTYYGYDRVYKFVLENRQNSTMWARAMIPDEYIESGTHQYDEYKKTEAELIIEWVINISIVNDDVQDLFIQNITNSPHVHCIGIIQNIIERDKFICHFKNLGYVIVELEEYNNQICENMKVEFVGSLRIEFDKDEFLLSKEFCI